MLDAVTSVETWIMQVHQMPACQRGMGLPTTYGQTAWYKSETKKLKLWYTLGLHAAVLWNTSRAQLLSLSVQYCEGLLL